MLPAVITNSVGYRFGLYPCLSADYSMSFLYHDYCHASLLNLISFWDSVICFHHWCLPCSELCYFSPPVDILESVRAISCVQRFSALVRRSRLPQLVYLVPCLILILLRRSLSLMIHLEGSISDNWQMD